MHGTIPETMVANASLLVVDDIAENLNVLSGMLKKHGYRVRPVPSGELALTAARQSPPDLILLDIMMPGMSGYEVCAHLKAEPALREIPVIFISALDQTFDKVRAFTAGGVDFITKPYQIEEVAARVRTHLLIRQQERQLRDSLARLHELEALRDNLVHMIVHDMRSPICSIQLFMDMLQQPQCDPISTIKDLSPVAVHATAVLRGMITQLLDISRLEAGQMPLKRETHDLAQTLRTSLDAIILSAARRRLQLDVAGACPAFYDQELIGRTVANLLSNAVKFTPPNGEIRLTLEQHPDRFEVRVADNGCGVAFEHQRKIFDKFGQAELKNKSLGTGLGLAFCRLVVEAHGGQIGVNSASGKGSTFWFTLPVQSEALPGRGDPPAATR